MRAPTTNRFLATALLLLLLISQVFNVAGQSGRKTPPPPSTDRIELQPAFVPDPARDEYQLIVPQTIDNEKRKNLKTWDRQEYYAATLSRELNRVGAQGYRLISMAVEPVVAVMRRADHQYEYAIIEIISRRNLFPNDPEFGLTYDSWARKGFRVADYLVLGDGCQWGPRDPMYDQIIDYRLDCSYSSRVVLERRKGAAEMDRRYQIVHPQPTFSKSKLDEGLTEGIYNARTTNLYPTHLLTKFQLLTQSPTDVNDLAAKDYETAIATGDVKKRINELAQQGYRLLMRPLWDAAIMHRKKGPTEPASYIWVGEKKLEQELPRLGQQGFVYRMNYGCRNWENGPLIFEQPSEGYDKPREYKVLAIELKVVANEKFGTELTSNGAVQELKRLTNEGFEVRDFFGCYVSTKKRPSRARILLERVKP